MATATVADADGARGRRPRDGRAASSAFFFAAFRLFLDFLVGMSLAQGSVGVASNAGNVGDGTVDERYVGEEVSSPPLHKKCDDEIPKSSYIVEFHPVHVYR
jgi:hypothetical protein